MNDEPPIVHGAERVRTWWRLFVVAAVVAGAAAVVAGVMLRGRDGLVVGVASAALFWSGAAYLHLTWLAVPDPAKRTHRVETADGVEFRVDLRPHLPLSMLAAGGGLVVFFGILGLWMGSMFWALAGAAFVLLGLVVIPDSVRALTATGRGAVLDARGFTYHGYSYVTRVAWDDIASAEFDTSNPRLPAMTFSLRPGANLTWTRRRWLAHLEPPPGPSRFTIPAIVLDQPWSVLALCSGMVETPVDRRAGYLASVGERMLVDPAFPHH